MNWRWYVGREDGRELLLDMDIADKWKTDRERAKASAIRRGEFLWKLAENIRAGRLAVERVFMYPSNDPANTHAVILLRDSMLPAVRTAWEMQLGSDRVRGMYDLVRSAKGIPGTNLLITSQPWPDFYREPDYACDCEKKHDSRFRNKRCTALQAMGATKTFGVALFSLWREHRISGEIYSGEVPMADLMAVGKRKN